MSTPWSCRGGLHRIYSTWYRSPASGDTLGKILIGALLNILVLFCFTGKNKYFHLVGRRICDHFHPVLLPSYTLFFYLHLYNKIILPIYNHIKLGFILHDLSCIFLNPRKSFLESNVVEVIGLWCNISGLAGLVSPSLSTPLWIPNKTSRNLTLGSILIMHLLTRLLELHLPRFAFQKSEILSLANLCLFTNLNMQIADTFIFIYKNQIWFINS